MRRHVCRGRHPCVYRLLVPAAQLSHGRSSPLSNRAMCRLPGNRPRANAISAAIAARIRGACARKVRRICRCSPVRVGRSSRSWAASTRCAWCFSWAYRSTKNSFRMGFTFSLNPIGRATRPAPAVRAPTSDHRSTTTLRWPRSQYPLVHQTSRRRRAADTDWSRPLCDRYQVRLSARSAGRQAHQRSVR